MALMQLDQVLTHIAPLSAESLAKVLQAFQPQTLKTSERLLIAGDVCEQLAFVTQGLLMSQSISSKKEASCDLFAEGDFATNYVSFLTAEPSTVEIVALEPSALLVISKQALQNLYDTLPEVERLGRMIAEDRFVASVHRAGSLLSESPAERYRALSLSRPDLLQRVPQYLLARWLGVTPESLSRIRQRLARQRKTTSTVAEVPSKSKAPASKLGGPKAPRASREKP